MNLTSKLVLAAAIAGTVALVAAMLGIFKKDKPVQNIVPLTFLEWTTYNKPTNQGSLFGEPRGGLILQNDGGPGTEASVGTDASQVNFLPKNVDPTKDYEYTFQPEILRGMKKIVITVALNGQDPNQVEGLLRYDVDLAAYKNKTVHIKLPKLTDLKRITIHFGDMFGQEKLGNPKGSSVLLSESIIQPDTNLSVPATVPASQIRDNKIETQDSIPHSTFITDPTSMHRSPSSYNPVMPLYQAGQLQLPDAKTMAKDPERVIDQSNTVVHPVYRVQSTREK